MQQPTLPLHARAAIGNAISPVACVSQPVTNKTKREEASTMEDFLSCLYSLYMIPYVFPRNITHYIKR